MVIAIYTFKNKIKAQHTTRNERWAKISSVCDAGQWLKKERSCCQHGRRAEIQIQRKISLCLKGLRTFHLPFEHSKEARVIGRRSYLQLVHSHLSQLKGWP